MIYYHQVINTIQSNQRGAKKEVHAARHLQVDAEPRARVSRRVQWRPDHRELEELGQA